MRGKKMNANIKTGMTVTFKAINGEQFIATVVEVDRYGFAVVNLGMSESRIAVTELAVA
jgi:hypothetical protein